MKGLLALLILLMLAAGGGGYWNYQRNAHMDEEAAKALRKSLRDFGSLIFSVNEWLVFIFSLPKHVRKSHCVVAGGGSRWSAGSRPRQGS